MSFLDAFGSYEALNQAVCLNEKAHTGFEPVLPT